MENKTETNTSWAFPGICAVIIAVSSYFLFGFTGIKMVAAMLIVTLPFYLLLEKLNLKEGERAVFSLILGFTIFPSIVYILGFFISFRISIFLTFFLVCLIALAVKYKSSIFPKKEK
jgi:hypothetical protein